MMMATAGALKRELIIRPKLAFTFMAMTTQSDPNTTCAKLAKDTATLVAVFGSASNSASRFREAASGTRNPGAAFDWLRASDGSSTTLGVWHQTPPETLAPRSLRPGLYSRPGH